MAFITKTYLYNFDPFKPHFFSKTGVYRHISAQNIDCGYSLEPPRRGGSVPTIMISENFHFFFFFFFCVKFSVQSNVKQAPWESIAKTGACVYLNRTVLVWHVSE